MVNGEPALERLYVKTDKASGIVNDGNGCAIDTMQDPKYPLKPVQRVITMKIVGGLTCAGRPISPRGESNGAQ